jgi:hypothetical protein
MPTPNYDASQIGSNTIHRARFLLGDVGKLLDNDGAPMYLVSDEELTALIGSTAAGFHEGVASACDHLVNRFSQEPDKFEDATQARVEWTNRLKGWSELAKRLRATAPGETQPGATPPPTAVAGTLPNPPGMDSLGL